MKKTLTAYLDTYNIISQNQFGFQASKSTFDALDTFSEFLYKNLDKGEKILSIFIDFKKAFDTVPHSILLEKLEYYGIRGPILNWFASYLTDRSQSTRYGDQVSNPAKISVGLPQGSVLGPLLFNIFINDLSNISEVMNLLKFCDDSTMYLKHKDINELIYIANCELHKLNDWVLANRLTINTDKTVAMLFSTRKITDIPLLFIRNNFTYDIIKRVEYTKFLGVYYDEQLRFKKHISFLCGKMSKLAGMFYSLRWILPRNILRQVYNAHVNSLLNYNTPIWCCNYPNNLKPLIVLQKKILGNVTKSYFLAHTQLLFKLSKYCD